MKRRQKILIVGFGDVAQRMVRLLDLPKRPQPICALVRTPEGVAVARTMGVTPIVGDLANRASLRRLAGVADLVFHFAPPPNQGPFDRHSRNLVTALSRHHHANRPAMLPQRLVYISTTGVYGDCHGEQIDETRPVHPQTPRAARRVDAERVLREWGRHTGVNVSILRAPGIYARERLPIERLQKGLPALILADDVFTNHIHADDLAAAALRAATRGRPNRVYNAVDDSELLMGSYFDLVADRFRLARPPRLSRHEAASKIGEAMLSFMSESRRIGNARLRRELDFSPRYPTVEDFLMQLAID